jgi:DNA-binding ferritin-like protein
LAKEFAHWRTHNGNVRSAGTNALNQLLADTIALRDLYKKHHWQVAEAAFYSLHLLFDKHYSEQVELMDGAEAQSLGPTWETNTSTNPECA